MSELQWDELNASQHNFLRMLSKGGTWEERSLPSISYIYKINLHKAGLVEYKGNNGICEYWAITDKGRALIPNAVPVTEQPSIEDWCVHPSDRELTAYADGYVAGMKDSSGDRAANLEAFYQLMRGLDVTSETISALLQEHWAGDDTALEAWAELSALDEALRGGKGE